jgi:hypothetical protein
VATSASVTGTGIAFWVNLFRFSLCLHENDAAFAPYNCKKDSVNVYDAQIFG